MHPSRWTLVLAFVSCATGSSARAQPRDRAAAAEALFQRGRSLVERGDVAAACPLFDESLRLDPGVGAMLWRADCYASTGRTASAWAAFGEAAAAAARSRDRRLDVAIAKRDELAQKLSRLVILVPREAAITAGLELRRDGVLVERAAWSDAVALDPGVHRLSASAPGCEPWAANVDLPPGPARIAVAVPALEATPDASPRSAAAPIATANAAEAPGGLGTRRWLGVASMGIGAVGLITGTVWSLEAKSTYDQSIGPCGPNNVCTQAGLDQRGSAHTLATEATIAMALGATAGVVGALVFFTTPRDVEAIAVAPLAWSSGGAVTMSGAF